MMKIMKVHFSLRLLIAGLLFFVASSFTFSHKKSLSFVSSEVHEFNEKAETKPSLLKPTLFLFALSLIFPFKRGKNHFTNSLEDSISGLLTHRLLVSQLIALPPPRFLV